jgi:ABC-type bacteriocin/lantibiotic exporter with double-glycine peptidase domain
MKIPKRFYIQAYYVNKCIKTLIVLFIFLFLLVIVNNIFYKFKISILWVIIITILTTSCLSWLVKTVYYHLYNHIKKYIPKRKNRMRERRK